MDGSYIKHQAPINARLLVQHLEHPNAPEVGRMRFRRISQFLGLFLMCSLLGMFVWGGVVVWQAWMTGVWPSYWTFQTVGLYGAAGLITLLEVTDLFFPAVAWSWVDEHARQVFWADAITLPITPAQPSPFTMEELPAGPERVGPLRSLTSARDAVTATGLAIATFVASAILFLFVLLPLADLLGWGFPIETDPGARAIDIAVVAAFVIGECLVLLFVTRQWRRRRALRSGLTIEVSSSGLRWHDPREQGEHILPWDTATAFLVIDLTATIGSDPSTSHILTSERERLAWNVSRFAPHAEKAAAEHLTRLIATYTALPLRDATARLSDLGRVTASLGLNTQNGRRMLTDLQRAGVDLPYHAIESQIARNDRRARRRAIIFRAGLLIGVLLVLARPAIQFYRSHIHGDALSTMTNESEPSDPYIIRSPITLTLDDSLQVSSQVGSITHGGVPSATFVLYRPQ